MRMNVRISNIIMVGLTDTCFSLVCGYADAHIGRLHGMFQAITFSTI